MPVEIRVIEDKIPLLLARVETAARFGVKRWADAVARDASNNAPVGDSPDGEHLYQNIIPVSVGIGHVAEVRVESDHGFYVEYGTYKMAAEPYLEPAIQAHEDDLPEEFLSALEI